MIRTLRKISWLVAIASAVPVIASAQTDVPDPSSAPIRLGVVALDPRFSVSQIGIDTNVFNTAENPQRDRTATAVTGATLSLRTGRGLLSVDGDAELLYFERFASQRSLSSGVRADYGVRLNRLRPFIRALTRDHQDRPNDEINARVRQYETAFAAGLDSRLFSRSTVRLEWQQQTLGFADSAYYRGQQLKQPLNHTAEAIEASWRQQLTGQTIWVARVSRHREEYEFEPARNAKNYVAVTGFELGQFALIRGEVLVGYQELRADNPAVLPDYSGPTTHINATYSAPTRTRLEITAERELRSSYDSRTPHYVQQSWNMRLTQQTFGHMDLQLTGGRAMQDYSPSATFAARQDYTDRVGGGIGYSMAKQMRLSLDVTSVNRRSQLPSLNYNGIKCGFSVTYGY
jgi:hypothetical protein